MKIAESLKDLVLDKNLSLNEISKQSGVNNAQLSMYVRGVIIPNVENSIKLAMFFNCSLNYLFGLSTEKDNPPKIRKISFYSQLNQLLKENKFSFYKLTKETPISDSSLTRWKKGVIPKIETLIILAKYFSCSIDFLVGATNA